MADAVSIALVGVGGYGNIYLSTLLDADRNGFVLSGAVDPSPASCKRLGDLHARHVPLFTSLDQMYERHQPAMVVVSSPIHLHCRHTVDALTRGSHVRCERPLCVTLEQAHTMLEARDRAGRQVAVGYQWSFCPAIQRLKQDVMAGLFGAPRRLRTLVLWPRDERYYRRNRWAGRRVNDDGEPVHDSPVSNACAHYLHNMLYILGPRVDRSATPLAVTAELYRAQSIESYDTAALRCVTEGGAELLFVASHATRHARGPVFSYEFENATVTFAEGEDRGAIVARFADGTTKRYGPPCKATDPGKLWVTLDAVRSGEPVPCGIEAAIPHMQVTCAAHQSTPDVVPFPAPLVTVEGEVGSRRTCVLG